MSFKLSKTLPVGASALALSFGKRYRVPEARRAAQVHERSPENDLFLACLRELMQKNKKTRLVLMSATADFRRYLGYFREVLGDDDIATVAVDASAPPRALSFQARTGPSFAYFGQGPAKVT